MPFLVWSFIYFLWRIYVKGEDLALSSFFARVWVWPVYYHLWFFYLIIGLYLLTPVLSIYLKHASRRNVWYFLALCFILGSALPFIESWFNIQTYSSTGTSNSIFKFLGYFMLGHFLRDLRLTTGQVLLFVLLFFGSLFITAYGTYYATVLRNRGVFDGIFYEYYSFNVIGMAVAIYVIGKSVSPPAFLLNAEEKLGLVSTVAACVPGIYLIHAMFIEIAKKGMLGFRFSQDTLQPALGIPVFALAIFTASLLVVLIIRQLPLIRHIMP